MTLRQTAMRAAFWGAAQKWGHHGVRLVVFTVLVRLLSPESFGLVALASVFILLGEQLVDQGFNDALVQRKHLGPAHLDAAFWAALAGGLVFSAATATAAAPLAAAFDQPRLAPVLSALAPSLLLAAVSRTQEAILRRQLAFRPIAAVGLTAVVAGGVTGLAMAFAGYGVWALVGQQLTQRLVEVPCYWWATGWRPRWRFSPRHFRQLLRFGSSVIGINLFNFGNRQMDHLLIGYFLGTTALGFYTVGYRLVRILLDLLPHALMPVVLSAFARLQSDPVRLRAGFYDATRLMALVAFPAFCGMGLVAHDMVPVLFGAKWLPSVPVLQALVPIGLLQSVAQFYPTVMKAVGRPGRALMLAGMNVTVNAVAFFVAVHWGIVAVAAAYSIRGYLLWPVSWLVLRGVTGVRLPRYLRSIAPALGATAVMALLLIGARAAAPPDADRAVLFGAGVMLGVAAYALTLCRLSPGLCRRAREMVAQRSLILKEQGHEG